METVLAFVCVLFALRWFFEDEWDRFMDIYLPRASRTNDHINDLYSQVNTLDNENGELWTELESNSKKLHAVEKELASLKMKVYGQAHTDTDTTDDNSKVQPVSAAGATVQDFWSSADGKDSVVAPQK